MRLLVGCAFALVVILAIASSCILDRRSSDFDCTVSTDCSPDRMCENGFCVLLDPTACGKNCTDVGGQCNGSTCEFTCSSASCAAIQCPPQIPCTIDCDGTDACSATSITCGNASCTINCNGPDSCGQRLVTGTGPTTVNCSGAGSCAGGTDCDAACSCTVTCSGSSSCATPADCHGSSSMCADGNGCTLGGNCKNDCF